MLCDFVYEFDDMCKYSTAYGHEPYCNVFDFIVGYIFYPNTTMQLSDQVNAFIDLVLNNNGYYALNKNAYNASFAAVASKQKFADPILNNINWRNEAYQFCLHNYYGVCSMLAVRTKSDSDQDKSITPPRYLLNKGSCARQFAISNASFLELSNTVPTPFVESYFECTMYLSAAISNAFGIAASNVSTLVPFVMVAFVPLCIFVLYLFGITWDKPEFTKSEIEDEMEILAVESLRKKLKAEILAESSATDHPVVIKPGPPSRKHSILRKFNTKVMDDGTSDPYSALQGFSQLKLDESKKGDQIEAFREEDEAEESV